MLMKIGSFQSLSTLLMSFLTVGSSLLAEKRRKAGVEAPFLPLWWRIIWISSGVLAVIAAIRA